MNGQACGTKQTEAKAAVKQKNSEERLKKNKLGSFLVYKDSPDEAEVQCFDRSDIDKQ